MTSATVLVLLWQHSVVQKLVAAFLYLSVLYQVTCEVRFKCRFSVCLETIVFGADLCCASVFYSFIYSFLPQGLRAL